MAASQFSPADVRTLCREDRFAGASTAGLASGHVQVNVLVLPSEHAADFRLLCRRNPTACPLVGETEPGDPRIPTHLARDSDIRFDCPAYTVYDDGKLISVKKSIEDEWAPDSVAFLIGCSFSFETPLVAAGLPPRHMVRGTNVPMYRTTVPLCPAGVFRGHIVVSARPYPASALEAVRALTRPYVLAHGEPIAWGEAGARSLGLTDLDGSRPDFGDPTELLEGDIMIYWACGVTPQLSVMDSGIKGRVLGHAPGQMLVLDMLCADVCL